jgi:hypothetical protein
MEDVYKRLAVKLNQMPHGFPETRNNMLKTGYEGNDSESVNNETKRIDSFNFCSHLAGA